MFLIPKNIRFYVLFIKLMTFDFWEKSKMLEEKYWKWLYNFVTKLFWFEMT